MPVWLIPIFHTVASYLAGAVLPHARPGGAAPVKEMA